MKLEIIVIEILEPENYIRRFRIICINLTTIIAF